MTRAENTLAASPDAAATAIPLPQASTGGKLYIKTQGCQMNVYDSARMADLLAAEHGLSLTEDESEADVILINTCSIREKAQEKVFSQLGRWKHLKAGGKPEQCGWICDQYGLRWQIVPAPLQDMMSDADRDKAKRVSDRMLKMEKFDFAELQAAYDGAKVGTR